MSSAEPNQRKNNLSRDRYREHGIANAKRPPASPHPTCRRGKKRALGLAIAAGLVPSSAIATTPVSGVALEKVQEQTLYRFCPQSGCVDGARPGSLTMDAAGNLYGTTYSGGGPNNAGVVFKLSPDPSGTIWSQTILYRFCSQTNCADGAYPNPGLVIDGAGNVYGTTNRGGNSNGQCYYGSCGVVFELTPDASGAIWSQTTVYSFCSERGCADGANPAAGLIIDTAGNLYGTTYYGAGANNGGMVFELMPDPSGSVWSQTILYRFCSQSNCPDGAGPNTRLLMDQAANLYGTTLVGGTSNNSCWYGGYSGCGVVFKLTPSDTGWTEQVLYNICSQSNCADGALTTADLIIDAAGNLYGTTQIGGTSGNCGMPGCGVVFQLTPDASGAVWTETILYNFCSNSACLDGYWPYAGLVMDGAGNLYGTTSISGDTWGGLLFVLSPTDVAWMETILHRFCSEPNCADGGNPRTSLIMDAAGRLFGTTSQGGNNWPYGTGVVFGF
jgi:uncharacterized repeat protein (TIGR03803 family)